MNMETYQKNMKTVLKMSPNATSNIISSSTSSTPPPHETPASPRPPPQHEETPTHPQEVRDYYQEIRHQILQNVNDTPPPRTPPPMTPLSRTPRTPLPRTPLRTLSGRSLTTQNQRGQSSLNDLLYLYFIPTTTPNPTNQRNTDVLTDQQIISATENVIIDLNTLDLNNNVCPISLENYRNGETVLKIKHCNHMFKTMHLMLWFRSNCVCPVCRHDIRQNNLRH